MRTSVYLFTVGVAATFCLGMLSADAKVERINAKLYCGPHSSNPAKLREFQANLVFTLAPSGELKATRRLTSGHGQEVFTGRLSPGGAVLMSGQGSRRKGGPTWSYEFTGNRSNVDDTVLEGEQVSTVGAVGTRKCKLTFFKPRAL